MNVRDRSRKVGIAAALATVIVLAAPYAVVSGHEGLLISYYSAGPIGAGGVGLFAAVSVVVLASLERGNVDPGTLAGVAVVLGAATTLAALLWYVSIDAAVLFSFAPEYRWLEWHAPAVIALSLPVPAGAGLYARDLLA